MTYTHTKLKPRFFKLLAERVECNNQRMHAAKSFIERLGSSWLAIQKQKLQIGLREGHHFSPLRLLSIKETDHSRLLGILLDPQGGHGQGKRFLHSFLELVNVDEPKSGNWRVRVEKMHVDILLVRDEPSSIVIIENKANQAADQNYQLYRYWYWQIYRRLPELNYDESITHRRFKVIYAPLHSFVHPNENSIQRPPDLDSKLELPSTLPLDVTLLSFHKDIGPWLKLQSECVSQPRIKLFLELYAEIWTL